MKIQYWTAVLKEKNSTFQPSNGTEIDCVLKENTSLMNPVFIITHSINAPIRYVKWVATERYYFVSDVVSVSNTVIEVHCEIDVLATYKTYIGQSSQYVLRSASASDGDVVDNLYPIKAGRTIALDFDNTYSNPFVTDISNGRYVVGIIGKGSSGIGGAVSYYVMTDTSLRALSHYMLSQNDYNIDDISTGLQKALFNPMQYISSCMWFPFEVTGTNVGGDISMGWWTVQGLSGVKDINSECSWEKSLTYTIPKHPMAQTRGSYLNISPYTELTLNAGPWGVIPIDTSLFKNETSINVHIYVDCITGTGKLTINTPTVAGNVSNCGVYYAQVGVPVQLGQNTLSQGAITGILGGFGSVATGLLTANPMLVVGGGVACIGSGISAQTPVTTSQGSNGSIASIQNNWALIAQFATPLNEDVANKGRPLCAVRTINTLSGFIVVENPHIDSYALDSERGMIDAFMRNGFYYE